MKHLFLITVLAGVAFAGGSLVFGNAKGVKYELNSTNAAPSTATAGLPVADPSNPNRPLSALSVTVADYSDGGADEDFIKQGNVLAWYYKPGLKYPDGGAGWQRMPGLDFTVDAGSTNAQGITTLLNVTTVPMGGSGQIYFSTSGVIGQDAGTPRHSVYMEARY